MAALKGRFSQYLSVSLTACALLAPATANASDELDQAELASAIITPMVPGVIEQARASIAPTLDELIAAHVPENFTIAGFAVQTAALRPEIDNSAAPRGLPPSVFTSVAMPIRSLPAAKQWQPVHADLDVALSDECTTPSCRRRAARLDDMIEDAGKMRFLHRLHLINSAINATIAYSSDTATYRRLDHWATPAQTVKAGRGDCEDFAILKMAALKAAGIPESSMRLVVVHDNQRGLFHAVLAVTTDQGHFILDNVHDQILRDTDIAHYQPLFSLSFDRYWLHGMPRKSEAQVAFNSSSLSFIAPGEDADGSR